MQKETAELVNEIMQLDCQRHPEWFPDQEIAQRGWIVRILDMEIPKCLDLAYYESAQGNDWMCFLDARIAANYAFMLRPDLREPRSWRAPNAMQWRGVKPEQWYPGYTWTETNGRYVEWMTHHEIKPQRMEGGAE